MIESNQFSYAVNTIPNLRLRDPVPRTSPMILFLSIKYNVTHRYYLLGSHGTTRVFVGEVGDPPLVLPLSNFFYESLLDRNNIAYHDLLSMLSQCEFEPQNCVGLAAEIIQKIVRIVCGVSRRRKHLRICCEIERKHEVIFEENDIIGVYNDGHMHLMEEIMDGWIMELQGGGEEENLGMMPANLDAIKLECVKVERDESRICTICLEEFTDFVVSMPCNHLFHSECIKQWLVVSHHCPICRYEMPTKA